MILLRNLQGVLSQSKPIHRLKTYFRKINSVLSFHLRFGLKLEFCRLVIFLSSRAYYITRLSHGFSFHHHHDIWWRLTIIKILIKNVSTSFLLHLILVQILSQLILFSYTLDLVLPSGGEIKFHAHIYFQILQFCIILTSE